ncbi:beta-ketoacyl-[acyl-carrier-protein] synthase II [Psittacicella hinzii]|uniref:Beta-ketoacyl-[acyl-carrier-protein] synthase II n=1 Tax=Psittacicella hinzii TaxID=2028575 RepID=A0A3A1Y4H2_9GAMM|nr:beta-ketoacyl-ACP synthase [Psittacicella hinzii]RIY31047.1 beta-ketoacyl-[acyl-carrier-protein] synthase II [Psittacicella hinzii]
MTKIFIHKPGIVSCVGNGLETHLTQLQLKDKKSLTQCENPFPNFAIRAGSFGIVKEELREFPENLPSHFRNRCNQLLWHALEQIEEQVQEVISKYGKHRVAVIMGTSTTGVDECDPYFLGKEKDIVLNQLFFSNPADFVKTAYNLTGVSFGISTACTSGARALISAARLLHCGFCDAVICGGVDNLSPLTLKGFDSLSVLSPENLNPFSENRQGTNIGEGAAVFVLTKEKLDNSALEYLGGGASCDSYHMSSPHPEGKGAIAALEQALSQAKLDAEQIGWVNLHGTATLHNDLMEAKAITSVLPPDVPCTSTKSYTGHTLGASGAIEAAILWGFVSPVYNQLGKLPLHLWDEKFDPQISPLNFTNQNSTWTKEKTRIGLSNSFAFGGNNAVIILGECNA